MKERRTFRPELTMGSCVKPRIGTRSWARTVVSSVTTCRLLRSWVGNGLSLASADSAPLGRTCNQRIRRVTSVKAKRIVNPAFMFAWGQVRTLGNDRYMESNW
jgi:hypothetical protein